MELLILRSDKNYIRFKNNNYLTVQLDKASVFPFDHMDIVQQHQTCLKNRDLRTSLLKNLFSQKRIYKNENDINRPWPP